MSFNWDKQSFPLWKDKVSYELIELRQQVSLLAVQIKAMQQGGAGGGSSSVATVGGGSSRRSVSVRPLSDYEMQEGQMTLTGELATVGSEEGEEEDSTNNIKQSSYAIQQATIAMRGYLMLLQQLGLSKDQKKMISELQTAMMMVMKIAATISVVQGLMELSATGGLDPTAWIQIVMAGGYASSSLAYGSKTVGGNI